MKNLYRTFTGKSLHIKTLLIGLLVVFIITTWFFIGKFASAGINIENTQDIPACLTFVGHGTTPAGDLYILGTDGERYEMPLTTAIQNANPNSYPALEEAAARVIEKKFCLPNGSIEIDIESGKYSNITVKSL